MDSKSLFCVLNLLTIYCLSTTASPFISSDRFINPKLMVNRLPGSLWPKPQSQKTTATTAFLSPDFDIFVITAPPGACAIIDQAVARYKDTIFKTGCQPLDSRVKSAEAKQRSKSKLNHTTNNVLQDDQMYNLTVYLIGQCEEWPSADMDEIYSLNINSPGSEGQGYLWSSSVWGIIRGLETFVQLLVETEPNEDGTLLTVNTTSIIDFPRFKYRGFLVDTSRHYLPVRVILENLEAMSQNKLNVFHWHIVDDQSFPYQSVLFPQLSQNGAYNPKTHIYTLEDIAHIIDFARQRGIRVIPEFDSPGHTLSWGKGVKDILTPCYKGTTRDGTYGPMNPMVNSTYDFLQQLLGEVAKVFPDSYLHLGGDEVNFDCWKSNPDIIKFMAQQGFPGDFNKLESYYIQKVVTMVQTTLNKHTVVWQEVFDNKVQLDKNTVVHVWIGGNDFQSEMANVTKAGFKTILSSCWYLNKISYGVDWHPYYQCEPLNFNGTDDQKKLVIGGAAAMWSEFFDSTGFMSRAWPRAATVAERLWSNQGVKDIQEAEPRLEEHRCRMMKRGLRVEPPNGPGFCPCDYL